MAAATVDDLRARAEARWRQRCRGAKVVDTEAVAGGGSAARPDDPVARRGPVEVADADAAALRRPASWPASTTASCATCARSTRPTTRARDLAHLVDRLGRRAPVGVAVADSRLTDRRAAHRCESSRPPATSTTASRRSSGRSRAPIPTGGRRRRCVGSPSTSGSRSRTLPSRRTEVGVRRRARARPLPQEHARRGRRGRRRGPRRRGHRGVDAPERGAPPHPRPARRRARHGRDHARPTSSTTRPWSWPRLEVADHLAGTVARRLPESWRATPAPDAGSTTSRARSRRRARRGAPPAADRRSAPAVDRPGLRGARAPGRWSPAR